MNRSKLFDIIGCSLSLIATVAIAAALPMPSLPAPKAPAKGAPRLQALALASVEPSARVVALSNAIWTVCHYADSNLSVTVLSNDYRGCYTAPSNWVAWQFPKGWTYATNVEVQTTTDLLSWKTITNWSGPCVLLSSNGGAEVVSNDWSRARFYRLRLSK